MIKDANIVITGGAGSVGKELLRQLLHQGAGKIRVLDNSESSLFELEREYADHQNVQFICCDICNEAEVRRCFSGMDMCFHTAALKHVPLCERSPFSAVSVNIVGVEAIISAAYEADLDRVLFTSTDKAVNPTNVMGTSKLMGERLFTAANHMGGHPKSQKPPIFASTRFGNVAGSSGSVIPTFLHQIAQGGPVTLTDKRMTRFVMTIEHAVSLVINSARHAHGGEVFITKMPALRIRDLARVMIDRLAGVWGHAPEDIEVKVTGPRPGEKLWEELSTEEESRRVLEGEEYLIVLPGLTTQNLEDASKAYGDLSLVPSDTVYHSEHAEKMNYEEIMTFLAQPGVLPEDLAAHMTNQPKEA